MSSGPASALGRPAGGKAPAPPERSFEWRGKDGDGREVQGQMTAASERVVMATLRRQGIRAEQVQRVRPPGERNIKEKQICGFTRQLSTMLQAGIPLLQAFDILARGQSDAAMRSLVLALKTDVETGSALSAAFARHPRLFDRLFCNLVRAGETGGVLDTMFDRLATYREKMLLLKSRVRSALIYPASVLSIAVVVMAVILLWVVPAFEEIFRSFGAQLPLPTRIVIGLSKATAAFAPYAAIALIGGALAFRYRFRQSESLRRRIDGWLLRLPVVGRIVETAVVARWCRTLATLQGAGVTLVEALDSVAGAAGNLPFADATVEIRREVSGGTRLSQAMAQTRRFPLMIQQMIAVGEESGALESMLARCADTCEQEVDEAVGRLSTLLEPFIMVVLGVVIGGLVIAMYLPIFQLGSVVG